MLGRGTANFPSVRQRIYLGCFVVHFLLLITVSLRDTLWLIARGYTCLPRWFEKRSETAQAFTSISLGQTLSRANPARQVLNSYLQSAGTYVGYCYFAPAVPNSYKLVFEIHHSDGQISYDLPRVGNDAAGIRFASLLGYAGETQFEALREIILKMLASAIWQEHPDAFMIRAVFGSIEEPTSREALHGEKASYKVSYAYDFSFTPNAGSD